MYQDYFGLSDKPFSIAPNPQYLYMSDRHREALAHLVYGIKSDGGFILLTGEVGTGKTTVCRCLLEQIPEEVDIAFILNPKQTATELLATACDDLGIDYPPEASIKVLVDRLNQFLLDSHASGRRTVLIIDEAQNLSVDVLEQLRLLTNLETNQRKLLQIILLGQPELLDILAKPELRQLSQRVTARFHLDALHRAEVDEYINHRLSVAGARGSFFNNKAIERIYRHSQGIPRVINLICERALLGAYAEGKSVIDRRIVDQAAAETLGLNLKRRAVDRRHAIAALVLIVLVIGAAVIIQRPGEDAGNTIVSGSNTEVSQPVATASTAAVDSTPTLRSANVTDGLAPAANLTTMLTPPPEPLHEVSGILGHTIKSSAFTDLFTLWGIAFADEEVDACDRAEAIGLKCFEYLSSFDDLRNLNRPAIINLKGEWFTLSELHEDTAILIAANRQYEVSLDDLMDNWLGEYTIFWQTPPDYRGALKRGDSGVSFDWLVEQLSPSTAAGQSFDAQFEQRVKRFQLDHDLTPDGIVGVKTWIHVNNVSRPDVPRLSRGSN